MQILGDDSVVVLVPCCSPCILTQSMQEATTPQTTTAKPRPRQLHESPGASFLGPLPSKGSQMHGRVCCLSVPVNVLGILQAPQWIMSQSDAAPRCELPTASC